MFMASILQSHGCNWGRLQKVKGVCFLLSVYDLSANTYMLSIADENRGCCCLYFISNGEVYSEYRPIKYKI